MKWKVIFTGFPDGLGGPAIDWPFIVDAPSAPDAVYIASIKCKRGLSSRAYFHSEPNDITWIDNAKDTNGS